MRSFLHHGVLSMPGLGGHVTEGPRPSCSRWSGDRAEVDEPLLKCQRTRSAPGFYRKGGKYWVRAAGGSFGCS